ncbi:hypothetical protein WMF01_48375 [Sorangium sp. So ce1667]
MASSGRRWARDGRWSARRVRAPVAHTAAARLSLGCARLRPGRDHRPTELRVEPSPNLSVRDAAGARGALRDRGGYDDDLNYRRLDGETFEAWGKRARVSRELWDIHPASMAR